MGWYHTGSVFFSVLSAASRDHFRIPPQKVRIKRKDTATKCAHYVPSHCRPNLITTTSNLLTIDKGQMDRKTVTKDEDDGAEVPLMVKVVPSQEHDDISNDGKTTGNEFFVQPKSRCGCFGCGGFARLLISLLVIFCAFVLLFSCGQSSSASSSSSSMGSCLGNDACQGNTGKIAFGACNGDKACQYNSGNVAFGSCNGDNACGHNTGAVATLSCNGDGSCQVNRGNVAKLSCNGDGTCGKTTVHSNIGKASCNGDGSCVKNAATVGNGSCNGDGACLNNHRNISSHKCNGDHACVGGSSGNSSSTNDP